MVCLALVYFYRGRKDLELQRKTDQHYDAGAIRSYNTCRPVAGGASCLLWPSTAQGRHVTITNTLTGITF